MNRDPRHNPDLLLDRRRQGGVVLVIALLSLLLLAAAVFYIFNVGNHLQRRTETQHAADAAAASGAGWVARTMNLAAMNNVEITKLLAQVQVLDAMPSAVGNSLEDHVAALAAVEDHIGERTLAPTQPWFLSGLARVRSDLLGHVVMLEELDSALNGSGYDIAELTFYDVGGRHGQLWEAMFALDAMSAAAMENLGPLAQRVAVRAAEQNQRDGRATGFLVPFLPELPWERGVFTDFQAPFLSGRLPDDIDDDEFSRGPYDTIFGWWVPELTINPEDVGTIDYDYELESDYGIPGFDRDVEQAEEGEVSGYIPYGPMRFYRRQLDDAEEVAFGRSPTRGSARSWFAERAESHATAKANLLFGGGVGGGLLPDAQWDGQWSQYVSNTNAGGQPPVLFLYLEFSPVRTGVARQQAELVDWGFAPGEPSGAAAFRRSPGSDLDDTLGEKVADHVWRSVRRLYRTNEATGQREEYEQYLYFVWCAANNQGGTASFRNPNNFPADVDGDDLPAPIQFTADALTHDDASARAQYLRFYAAAEQPATASLWTDLFDGQGNGARPRRLVTATAAATVFNTHSWDLWTQMWHAQLAPVGDLDNMIARMRQTGIDTLDSPDLNTDEVGRTFYYLQAVAPLLDTVREPGDTPSGGSDG